MSCIKLNISAEGEDERDDDLEFDIQKWIEDNLLIIIITIFIFIIIMRG